MNFYKLNLFINVISIICLGPIYAQTESEVSDKKAETLVLPKLIKFISGEDNQSELKAASSCSVKVENFSTTLVPHQKELDVESKLIAEHSWYAGSEDCSKDSAKTPPMEILEVNPGYYIIRQNKCVNFEAPFLYLWIGNDGALLVDSGASEDADVFPIRTWVDKVLGEMEAKVGHPIKLIVSHSHSHGDHTAGDGQFRDRPNTQIIGLSPEKVASAFGIDPWPNDRGEIDLGGRKIQVIAIPGHEGSSVAFYDHESHDLLTGDTLYPGNIFLSSYNGDEFTKSVERLYQFSQEHPVRNILGAHIEMSSQPQKDYAYGSTYHPDEHSLPLYQEHLEQIHQAVKEMGGNYEYRVLDDFIIAF